MRDVKTGMFTGYGDVLLNISGVAFLLPCNVKARSLLKCVPQNLLFRFNRRPDNGHHDAVLGEMEFRTTADSARFRVTLRTSCATCSWFVDSRIRIGQPISFEMPFSTSR